MAKVYGFSEDGFRRAKDAINRVNKSPSRGTNRRRQPPVFGAGDRTDWTSYGGMPYAGPWPCAEQRCLKIPGITTPIIPSSYGFWTAIMDCNCTDHLDHPSATLEATDDPDIYRTTIDLQCVGTIYDHESCTNEGTWVWTNTDDDCGGFTCDYLSEASGSGWVWRQVAIHCPGACGCDTGDVDLDTPPTGAGQSLSVGCLAPSGGDGGFWTLQSQTNPDCNCELPYPDTAGVDDGDTTTTECTGTGTSTGEEGLQPSYWILNIVPTLDEFDHDLTTLSFYIGETKVREYYLDGKRQFCRPCINTFRLKSCGPTACEYNPPPIICVYPVSSVLVTPGTPLSCCLAPSGIPRYITLTAAPTGISGTCDDEATGSFLMEWDDTAGAWEYYFRGAVGPWPNPPNENCMHDALWRINFKWKLTPCAGTPGNAEHLLELWAQSYTQEDHTPSFADPFSAVIWSQNSSTSGADCFLNIGDVTFADATVAPVTGDLLGG